MKRITLLLLLSTLHIHSSAQLLDPYLMMGPNEFATSVDTLSKGCVFPAKGWVNAETIQPIQLFNTKLTLVVYASFHDERSRAAIKTLTRLQGQFPTLGCVVVFRPEYDYPTTDDEIKREMALLGSSLPLFVDRDGIMSTCAAIDQLPVAMALAPDTWLLHKFQGELRYEQMEAALHRFFPLMEGAITLNKEPFYGTPPHMGKKQPVLKYPFGLAANEDEGYLYVSDREGHRILCMTAAGDVLWHVGIGKPDYQDGELGLATVSSPQGLAFDPATRSLYIADTGNNRIRRLHIESKEVSTALGNGNPMTEPGGKVVGTNGGIYRPAGLHLSGNELYISVAGSGEIWRMDTRTQVAERVLPDPESKQQGLLQPAGIVADRSGVLFYSDASANAIYGFDKGTSTLYLGDANGAHGYADGRRDQVKFQHPRGICQLNGEYFIADVYNHTIRKADFFKRRAITLSGNGNMGFRNGDPDNSRYNQPSDIAVLQGLLYVTDAGNGVIRRVHPLSGESQTLRLHNFESLSLASQDPVFDIRESAEIQLGAGVNQIHYTVVLPDQYTFDTGGINTVSINARDEGTDITQSSMAEGRFTVEVIVPEGQTRNSFSFDFYFNFSEAKMPEKQYIQGVTYLQNYSYDPAAGQEHMAIIHFNPDE